MNIARCQHGEYDKGHCGQPDCPNYFGACAECNPPSVRQLAREVHSVWDATFGRDP